MLKGKCIVVLTAVFLLCSILVIADETSPAEKEQGENGVMDLRTAHILADWGMEHENVPALLAAAAIIKRTPVEQVEREREAGTLEGGAPEELDQKEGELNLHSVDALIVAAEGLAEGDDALTAVVASQKAQIELLQPSMGARGGPQSDCDYIRPGTRWTYRIRFDRGPAHIWAVGDGDGDLDLHVYAENGELLGTDVLPDSIPIVRTYIWVPQTLTIVLSNVGRIGELYCLYTN